MAVNGTKKVGVNLDLSSGAKLKNLPQASASGEAVEFAQLNAELTTKQDNMSGGNGVEIDGNAINIDLSESGTAFGTMTLSGTGIATLDGVYTRAPHRGHWSNSGLSLDWSHNTGDYAMYYKDNGGGVYAMLAARDTDGDNDTYGGIQGWMALLTSVNPATLSGNVFNQVPNYAMVDHFTATYSNETDENGALVPDGNSSFIGYVTGSGSSYLKFNGGELLADVVTNMNSVGTGKLVDSSTVKTYIDEQSVVSRTASSNTFINATASLTGSPSNVQSAIEAAASEIDSIDSTIILLNAKDAMHDNRLDAHDGVLGVTQLASNLGSWSGAAASLFSTNSNVKAVLVEIADIFAVNRAELAGVLGLLEGDTDFGDGFTVLSNDSDAKNLFQEIESELQNLSQGLGQFWNPVSARSIIDIDISSPGTDTFDGATVSIGNRVLLMGQNDPSENGIYIWSSTSTQMVRSLDANESSEFTINKTVQVLASSTQGVSGATFAYTNGDDPTLGSDDLPFSQKSQGVVGDASITEPKLGVDLAAKLNDKSDKYAETVTLTSGVPVQISHGLSSMDVIVQVRTVTGGNVTDIEIDITDSSFVTVNSLYDDDYRVVVIG